MCRQAGRTHASRVTNAVTSVTNVPASGTVHPSRVTNAVTSLTDARMSVTTVLTSRVGAPVSLGARASPRDARVLHARAPGRPRDPGSDGRGRYAVEDDGHASLRRRGATIARSRGGEEERPLAPNARAAASPAGSQWPRGRAEIRSTADASRAP